MGSIAMFKNGTSLKTFQALDLQRMYRREQGEPVCSSAVTNNTGYILAYEMGYGKTVTALALICMNPAKRNGKGSRATLVLCPNQGIMMHWRKEVGKFTPGLRLCYYDSISAPLDYNADIILATYRQTILQHASFNKDPKDESKAPLFHVHFHRVIADEAHIARNPDTQTAIAMQSLSKDHGLCLTGTPAQNSPADLFSLFAFLNVAYRDLNTLSAFQTLIYKQKQKYPIADSSAELLDMVMKDFCIFCSKVNPQTGKPLVALPPRTDEVVAITLKRSERTVYDYVKSMRFGSHLAKIMHLRQACDHPMLLVTALGEEDTKANETNEIKMDVDDKEEAKAVSQPVFVKYLPHELDDSLETFRRDYKSSKITQMMTIVSKLKYGEKAIVFTHFTSMIPAMATALHNARIAWTKYTGDMTTMQREHALEDIAANEDCTAIIVSITAASVGLDITACNVVIIMEPWWNPFVEEQAISRVYRIGQTRPVRVYRLVTRDSIEEAITETQKMKRDTMGNIYVNCDVPDNATLKQWIAH